MELHTLSSNHGNIEQRGADSCHCIAHMPGKQCLRVCSDPLHDGPVTLDDRTGHGARPEVRFALPAFVYATSVETRNKIQLCYRRNGILPFSSFSTPLPYISIYHSCVTNRLSTRLHRHRHQPATLDRASYCTL